LKHFSKILVFVFVTFSYIDSYAQELNTLRLEVPADIDIESYHVEALAQKGVLIFYESSEFTAEKKRKWYFGYFDTNLKQKWLKFLPLEDKMQFLNSYEVNNTLHLIFRNNSGGRNEVGFYEILSFDSEKEVFEQISGTFPAKAEIVGFEVIGNTACLGINIDKEGTDLLFVNLNSGEINPVHLAESYPSYIETVFANKFDNKFYVALKVKQDNRYIKDLIHIVSSNGKTLDVKEIISDDNSKLLRKFTFCAKNNELSVLGIYDYYKGRLNDFSKMEDEDDPKTAGLFFLNLRTQIDLKVKFIDFLKLDNINGSVANKKAIKVKDEDGENEQVVSAFFNINKPEVVNSKEVFLFTAEAYKPHYVTETRMDYDFYGRPYPYTYSVFAGYLFYDVIIVSLDKNGDLLWNNDFILRDLKSFSLKRHSLVFEDGNNVTATYVNNGKIFASTFDGKMDIGSDESDIASSNEKDRVVQDENNHIEKWYHDYFIIYGYQKIKNRSLSKKDERVIFYLNKVAYK